MDITTSVHFTEGAHFPWASIGGTGGGGGVTYFNGTIINDSEGDVPVTFSDDVRIDGMFFRWDRGDADGRPLIAGDSLVPGLNNANRLGYSDLRWSEVWTNNLRGDENVHENNLAVNNSPTRNYVLAFNADNRFMWVDVADHDTLSGLSCTSGQVAKWNGTAWACADDNAGANQVVYYNELTQPTPNPPTSSCIASGRRVVTITRSTTDLYFSVDLTADTASSTPCNYTSTTSYTVTATYDRTGITPWPPAPVGAPGIAGSIATNKTSTTTFDLIVKAPGNWGSEGDEYTLNIDWQATGY